MQVRFKLEKETKGALRYQEVDDKGEPIEQAWAKGPSTSARALSNVAKRSRRPYG